MFCQPSNARSASSRQTSSLPRPTTELCLHRFLAALACWSGVSLTKFLRAFVSPLKSQAYPTVLLPKWSTSRKGGLKLRCSCRMPEAPLARSTRIAAEKFHLLSA